MAEEMVSMLRETRYCMEVLSREFILGDTGRMQLRYQMQTHADREAEISKELAIQRNFNARVKLVSGGKYTITTKPAPETLSGNALAERIQAIRRHMQTLGYTRHYSEVEREIRERALRLLGITDDPPPTTTNGHRRPTQASITDAPTDEDLSADRQDEPPPPGSFSLD
jgi:hypothetical protein